MVVSLRPIKPRTSPVWGCVCLLAVYVDVEPDLKKMMDIWAEIGIEGEYPIRRVLLESLLTTLGRLGGVLDDDYLVATCRFMGAHLLFPAPHAAQLNGYATVMSFMRTNAQSIRD